eukprot:XP_007102037.1 gasdermin-A-like [Physeter catodon]
MTLGSSLVPSPLLGPENTGGRGSPVPHRLLKGILQQVASILEPNFNQTEETTFSLPPEVLSSLQSEDVALTRSLVEGCELEPQGPGRQLTWDPGMVPQPSALYVSLAGLQLLAAPGPAALQADA